jgi:hypothetical protein
MPARCDRAFCALGLRGTQPCHERVELGLDARYAQRIDEIAAGRLEK